MDPLTALGLASNIVQFVDYGCRLISDGYELYENGTLDGVEELQLVTNDLIRLANDLTTNPSPPKKPSSTDDGGLQQLAVSCKSLADKLLHILASLKPENPRDGLECFRKALRKARKRGAIENLERKLEKIQSQLNLRLMAMLSNKQSEVSSALDLLTAESQRNGADIANQIDSMRSEVIAAVQKQQKPSKYSRGPTIQEETKIVLACRHLADETRRTANSQKILKTLHYQYIKERESNVKDAHLHTFEWIFDDICTGTGSQTRFVEWMKYGNGIYWIAGKAGSGKSTLVKYLYRHARTLKTLQAWAGTSHLVLASHFFWSAGNQLQRSHIGLLQSLLYQILRQCPYLIEVLCTARLSMDDYEKPETWSLKELSVAFEKLAACNQMSVRSTKFCFFVDGLDEYDGEHTDVIRILQTMVHTPNIKICVSSRPWNVFEKAFGNENCHKLLLQEYTSPDIELYVRTTLEDDEGFSKLVKEDDRYQQLIQDVVGKAQGVFLWVFLVVRSLLRGLADENEFSFLQRRLNQLPSDLEEYFFHILDTVEPIYQEQTAQIFQLAMHSKIPLPAITLFFLELEKTDPNYSLRLDLHLLSETEIVQISQRMKKHVNACCKDLLEVNVIRHEDSFFQYKIDFLHRTVRDFLMTKDMSHLLKSRTADFEPHTSLCRIVLCQIKTYPLIVVNSSALMSMIHELLQYAREAEIHNGTPQTAILDELNRVLSITAQNRKRMGPFPSNYTGLLKHYTIINLLELAVSENLKLYVSSKLKELSSLPPLQPGQKPLLYHALHMHRDDTKSIWDADNEMVKLLLDLGYTVNERAAKDQGDFSEAPQNSVWESYLIRCVEFCLQYRYEISSKQFYRQSEFFSTTELLIESGADTSLQIQTNVVGTTRTARVRLDAGHGEFVVGICEPQYVSARKILEETFPGEEGRIAALCEGYTAGTGRRRWWGNKWFWFGIWNRMAK